MKLKRKDACLYFILPLFFFFFIRINVFDDIYFLLSHGKYILNNGFPYKEILSMHSNYDFVMQQWLSSVIYYVIFNLFKEVGLYIFLFIINGFITFLVYKLCLIISDNRKYISCFISSIIMILLEMNFIVYRPQVFSYIIFLILVIILELYKNSKRDYLLFIPILSVLLVNLHGAVFPIYFILMLPYLANYIIIGDKKFIKLFIIFIISFICLFINPYGIDMIKYAFNSYGIKLFNIGIDEMKHFSFTGDFGVVMISYLSSILFGIGSYFIIKTKKFDISSLLLFIGTFIMCLMNIRNFALFLLFGFSSIVNYINIYDDNSYINIKRYLIIYSVLIIGLFGFSFYNKNYLLFSKNNNYGVVNYLNKNTNKDISIYTGFDDGSYISYFGYKTYIDGRAEVFLKKNNHVFDLFNEYYYFSNYGKNRDMFINKYKFDYYVVSIKDKELINYLSNNDILLYNVVYKDKYRVLLKKE